MALRKRPRVDRLALERAAPQPNYNRPWVKVKNLRTLNLLFLFPLISQFSVGYDANVTVRFDQDPFWQQYFSSPEPTRLGLMKAAYWVGGVIGALLISVLADKLGRRFAIFAGAALCVIGTVMQTVSLNDVMFIIGRFVLGIGGVISGAVGPILMAELAHPCQRATVTALANVTFMEGALVSGLVLLGSSHLIGAWSWRLPSMIQAAPSLLQAGGIWLLPESPRWLISKARHAEALRVLAKYHGEGNEKDFLVRDEYREIRDTIEIDSWTNIPSWIGLFQKPANRWRCFILVWCGICTQWSGTGLVTSNIGPLLATAGVTTSPATELIPATSLACSFLMAIPFTLLPGKVGRRPLLLASLAGMCISLAMLATTTAVFQKTKDPRATHAFIAFIYLYDLARNVGWIGTVLLYVIEILPYSLRARGIGLFWLTSGLANALNTYVNPIGLSALSWRYYLVFVGWIVVEFIMVFVFFIETKGPTLENVPFLFQRKNQMLTVRMSRKTSSDDDSINSDVSNAQRSWLRWEESKIESLDDWAADVKQLIKERITVIEHPSRRNTIHESVYEEL